MEILCHFDEAKSSFVILKFKDAELEAFLGKLPKEYLSCYITDEDLSARVKFYSSTKRNELLEILPDQGNIQSGDFGEILSYFLVKEKYKSSNVHGPKKWRWKQEKNVAAPYSDVILFSISDIANPDKSDLLVSVESKMKATKNNAYKPIQNAIEGAEKDYVSRIAHSLSWLRKKYKDEGLKSGADIVKLKGLVDYVERFIKSESVGEYTKELTAIAIVDSTFLENELSSPYTIPTLSGTKLEIIVVSMKDLKKIYERVFNEIHKL